MGQQQNRQQEHAAVGHVAEEAWHTHAGLLGDRFDHEVWTIADIGHRAHEHSTQGDPSEDHFRHEARVCHEIAGILSRLEEDQVGWSVVEERRQSARCPEESGWAQRTGQHGALFSEDLQRGLHADKDADEQASHFDDGVVVERVLLANFAGSEE